MVSLSPTTNFYNDIADYSIPTTVPTSCATTKQAYNQHFEDAKTQLRSLVDPASTCLPDAMKYKESINLLREQRNELIKKYNEQKELFETYVGTVDVLQNARGPVDEFMEDLKTQQSQLEKDQFELQQKIRAGRRRFLDSDPQAGVQSVLGLQTADDKILLAFWICFVLGVSIAILVIIMKYGDALQLITRQQQVTAFVVTLLLSMAVAQLFIRQFA